MRAGIARFSRDCRGARWRLLGSFADYPTHPETSGMPVIRPEHDAMLPRPFQGFIYRSPNSAHSKLLLTGTPVEQLPGTITFSLRLSWDYFYALRNQIKRTGQVAGGGTCYVGISNLPPAAG